MGARHLQKEKAAPHEPGLVPPPLRLADNQLAGKRAAVLLYSYYPDDPRPAREAEALVVRGMKVDLICLRDGANQHLREVRHGINVLRMPLRRRREGKLVYLAQYLLFSLFAFATLSVRALFHRYSVVHVHNMPDFLIFAALVPRLLGAKLILDLHDPMPELSMSIYHLRSSDFLVRLLKDLEKVSIGFADVALTPNLAFQRLFISRGCPPEKMKIVLNTPHARIFNRRHALSWPQEELPLRPFTVMYHGLLAERHGLDIAIRAMARVCSRIPETRFLIYGAPTRYLKSINVLIQELDLGRVVQYQGPKSLEEVAQAIAASDLGIIPNRRTIFTEINLPTRIFEYLAMGKPVIVPRTRGIQDYFEEDEIIFFESEDLDDLAAKIEWVYAQPAKAGAVTRKGRRVYGRHLWTKEKWKFIGLVEGLVKREALG